MPTQTDSKIGVKVNFSGAEIGELVKRAALAYLGLDPDRSDIGICATPITDVDVVVSSHVVGRSCRAEAVA
jgi:hypothetical protein